MSDAWVRHSLEETGRDLGRLRRGTRETPFEWETTRLADRMWWLLADQRPRASDLVKEGWPVEQALKKTDYETRLLNRQLGYV